MFQPCFDGRRCQGRSGERPGVGHVPGPRVVVGRAHDVGRHQGRPPQHVSFWIAVKMLDYEMLLGWFFFKVCHRPGGSVIYWIPGFISHMKNVYN